MKRRYILTHTEISHFDTNKAAHQVNRNVSVLTRNKTK